MRSVHVVITGRVQGVGYRAWVEREAALNNLSGWVRNRRDGSVEAVIAGDDVKVAGLIEAMRAGPPGARVDGLDVAPRDGTVEPEFRVLPTA